MTRKKTVPIYLGREFKLERGLVYLVRAITRLLTFPLSLLRESQFKLFIRQFVLRFQNSLPIELAVSKGEVAVQIGTPRPRTVRRFSRAVGASGHVFVFEAEPVNFQRLQDAVKQEGLKNVTLIHGAAWSSSGEGELSLSPYSGDHKIRLDDVKLDNDLRPGNQQMGAIKCRFYSIDDVLSEHGVKYIHYLSVTVNGAELEVLKGAKQTLLNSPGIRVYAKGHALQADGQPMGVAIQNWLESLGLKTMKTKGEPSSTIKRSWQWRSGDVFAWKQPEEEAYERNERTFSSSINRDVRPAQKIEQVLIALLVLLIAALPFQFVRLMEIAGFKLNVFHLTALILIATAAYSYKWGLFRSIRQFEIGLLVFLASCALMASLSPAANITNNLLTFVIKPAFYIVLLRSLIVTMSSLEAERLNHILRNGVMAGILLFLGIFIAAMSLERLGVESGDLCDPLSYNTNAQLIQQNATSSDSITSPDNEVVLEADKAYNNIFIATLQEFDLFPVAKPISCARDIGPNAIAGSFLLYFCILLLFLTDKRRGIDWIMISICMLFLTLTNSRGGIALMLISVTWYWISRQSKLRPMWQALYIPGLALLFALLAASVMTLCGMFDAYLLQAAAHSARLAQYYEAIQLIQESPLWGMGLGYKLVDTYGSIYVHNFFLSSGVMMGILGLVSAGIILGLLLLNILRSMTQPLGNLIYGKQAVAAAILLLSPLLTLMARSSIESIFLLGDWISIAIFLVIVGRNNQTALGDRPLSYETTTNRVAHP